MEKTCIARLPSTLTRGESAEPREERGSPGPARVAAAPRRPRTRPPRARPPVRAPSWTRRSLRCPLPRVPPGRRRGVEARGWSRWSFPCSPSWPSRCGGGPEPDRLGRRGSTMNNHPGTLHGRVPDAGIPQPAPGVSGPNAAQAVDHIWGNRRVPPQCSRHRDVPHRLKAGGGITPIMAMACTGCQESS